MNILFVIADVFFSEPLGVMGLSAICRQAGHRTRLAILEKGDLASILDGFQPDLIGYSVMSPQARAFRKADEEIKAWSALRRRVPTRIMGGPHPTYFPGILMEMGLDAICIGDGDYAILRIIERLEQGRYLDGIPNIATPTHPVPAKEVVEYLSELPFVDRDLLYDAAPEMLSVGIRSVITMRGCPYKCTYCFNHAYNKMFKGDGRKLLRRRSVDDVINEVKYVSENYPKARFIRFADDVFVVKHDEWLDEFAERFPKEVGLPFYCLIRANAVTDEVATALSKAGCKSVSMSIESGDERVRNDIMKRNMSDQTLVDAFRRLQGRGINVFGNSIIAIPGTGIETDIKSYFFSKSLAPAAPTFSVFCPYPGTDLTTNAMEMGLLDSIDDWEQVDAANYSVLNCYTPKEKQIQRAIATLGPVFIKLPSCFDGLFKFLIRLPLLPLYSLIGSISYSIILSTKIFPGAQPRDPIQILKSVWRAARFFLPKKQLKLVQMSPPKGRQP